MISAEQVPAVAREQYPAQYPSLLGSLRASGAGKACAELLDPAGFHDTGLGAGVEGVRFGRHVTLEERIGLAVHLDGVARLHGRPGDELRAGLQISEDDFAVIRVNAFFHGVFLGVFSAWDVSRCRLSVDRTRKARKIQGLVCRKHSIMARFGHVGNAYAAVGDIRRSASAARVSAQLCSILSEIRSSARVLPRLIAATGNPSWTALRTKRRPDSTISEEPTTNTASLACNASMACATRGRGTFSP